MTNCDLEERLLQDVEAKKEIDSARAFLITSGIQTEEGVQEYLGKLQQIYEGFARFVRQPNIGRRLDVARATRKDYSMLIKDSEVMIGFLLHDYFWQTKPERYNSEALFGNVVDNQLSSLAQKVGNCLGLVCLHHAVGNLAGITTVPIISENHIYLMQKTKSGNYPIETTSVDGFNYDTPIKGEEKSINQFFFEIYNHRLKKCNDETEKERLIDNGLRINPNEVFFLVSKGARLMCRGKFDNARAYFERAMMADPNEVVLSAYTAYLTRVGKLDEARRYARIAQKMNPNPNDEIKPYMESVYRVLNLQGEGK